MRVAVPKDSNEEEKTDTVSEKDRELADTIPSIGLPKVTR